MPMLVATDERAAADLERLGQGGPDPLRGCDGVVDRVRVLDEDGELVAPEARRGVLHAQDGTQAPCHLHEDVVTGVVAEGVVHGLEAVEVEIQDCRTEPAPHRPMQRLLEPVAEEDPVGQPGERVGAGRASAARARRPGAR